MAFHGQRRSDDLVDCGQPLDLHALGQRLVGLELMRWHVRAVAAIDDERLVGAEPARRAGGVHRRVAAAVHHDAPPEFGRGTRAHVAQQRDGVQHADRVAGGDLRVLAHVRADRDEHRIEAAGVALGDDVGHFAVRYDPQPFDPRDLRHQVRARQAIGRDAEMQHATGQRARFVDLDLVAEPGEVIGGRKATGARAHHQDALARGRCDRHGPALRRRHVAQEPLDRMDRDGGVHLGAIAGGFARVVADPAMRRRQGVVGHERLPRPAVFAGLCRRQPGLHVLAGRAGVVAGWQQRDIVRQAGAEWAGAVALGEIDGGCQIMGLPWRRLAVCFVHFGLRSGAQPGRPQRGRAARAMNNLRHICPCRN
jgi:hypothetical protein